MPYRTGRMPVSVSCLILPEYSDGIAAEVVPEITLTTSDSASAWFTAFHARGIKCKCITFAEFKQVSLTARELA